MTENNISEEICDLLEIDYMDFTYPKNFMKLYKLVCGLEDAGFYTGYKYINNKGYHQVSALRLGDEDYYSYNNSLIKGFLECLRDCIKQYDDIRDVISEGF